MNRIYLSNSLKSARCIYFRAFSINSTIFKAKTPLQEYDRLVKIGKLRNDQYQRGILKSLGELHDALRTYHPPKIRTPNAIDQLGWKSKLSKIWSKLQPPTKDDIKKIGEGIPKGLYLYGDVGCGKTMLMDLFYETIPGHLSKKRIHFHQFMQYVHKRCHDIVQEQNLEELGQAKGQSLDPIPFLAAEIASTARLLCFDEFQVTDVADAMILRRLMTTLLSQNHGVVLFATSNRHPDELYINGVQRDTFIPCIELIKNRTKVVLLDSPTDYRKMPRPISSVYYFPPKGTKYSSKECLVNREAHVAEWYKYFAQAPSENTESHKTLYDYTVTTWGRKVAIPKCMPGRVAQFTFKQLCGEPLAAGDYLALATNFKAFIVTDIPYLSVYVRDEVRRFITFLDAVYDNGCKIATTSAADFNSLFVDVEEIKSEYELKPEANHTKDVPLQAEDDELVVKHGFSKEIAHKAQMFALDEEKFAFARALSRLSQMSSTEWVEK